MAISFRIPGSHTAAELLSRKLSIASYNKLLFDMNFLFIVLVYDICIKPSNFDFTFKINFVRGTIHFMLFSLFLNTNPKIYLIINLSNYFFFKKISIHEYCTIFCDIISLNRYNYYIFSLNFLV